MTGVDGLVVTGMFVAGALVVPLTVTIAILGLRMGLEWLRERKEGT